MNNVKCGSWVIEHRRQNAEQRFMHYVIEKTRLSPDDAKKVLALYKKHKLVKIDSAMGQFSFTNGEFASAWCIENSLKILK